MHLTSLTMLLSSSAPGFSGLVESGPSENYVDVRVGYSNSELVVYTAAFDRRLQYDRTITPAEMTDWDAVTLYLDLDGNVGAAPDGNAYRIERPASIIGNRMRTIRPVYRGNGSGWVSIPLAITTDAGWRGNAPNDNVDDRGWTSEIHIPFSSLGLAGRPADGAVWGLAVTIHDRDSQAGSPNPVMGWPEVAGYPPACNLGPVGVWRPGIHAACGVSRRDGHDPAGPGRRDRDRRHGGRRGDVRRGHDGLLRPVGRCELRGY